jgi:hypothetical protein
MSKPRKQCKKCPWKVDIDPYEIPDGYCPTRHANLKSTIADPGSLRGIGGGMQIMACHETGKGAELPCIGWLANQLGSGNNIALRLAVFSGRVNADFELDGEQHERFEDTLPSEERP